MDVVVIFNGLGNQMSQYAFYLQKKKINKNTFLVDFCREHNGAELSKIFGAPIKQTAFHKLLYVLFRILIAKKIRVFKPLQWLLKTLNCHVITEDYDYNFHEDYLIPSKGITFYYGGWPSEKYFIQTKSEIQKSYTFNKPVDEENIAFINKIKNTTSVAMHIRRGDYFSDENIKLFGNVCTKEYFQEAVKVMEDRQPGCHFFVFSNDIEWVKANLTNQNFSYVTINSGTNSWKDMYLMSLCKHNIISNSTFSWWGAWLNDNPDKIVISPKKYLRTDSHTDFYPESWLKLSDYQKI